MSRVSYGPRTASEPLHVSGAGQDRSLIESRQRWFLPPQDSIRSDERQCPGAWASERPGELRIQAVMSGGQRFLRVVSAETGLHIQMEGGNSKKEVGVGSCDVFACVEVHADLASVMDVELVRFPAGDKWMVPAIDDFRVERAAPLAMYVVGYQLDIDRAACGQRGDGIACVVEIILREHQCDIGLA